MVNEEVRAKVIARAKLKINRAQPLAILESVTLLEYIEELEAAQQSVQSDGDYCTCKNIVAWKIVGDQDVCFICNRPRR